VKLFFTLFLFPVESGDLTIDNFTFCKEVLGINDPAKEIIRDAKKIVCKVSMSCTVPSKLITYFSLIIPRKYVLFLC
jgi:hypothetical protein